MYVAYYVTFKYFKMINMQEINTLFRVNQLRLKKKIQRLFQ